MHDVIRRRVLITRNIKGYRYSRFGQPFTESLENDCVPPALNKHVRARLHQHPERISIMCVRPVIQIRNLN